MNATAREERSRLGKVLGRDMDFSEATAGSRHSVMRMKPSLWVNTQENHVLCCRRLEASGEGASEGRRSMANPTSFSLDATSRTVPLSLPFFVLPKNPPGPPRGLSGGHVEARPAGTSVPTVHVAHS